MLVTFENFRFNTATLQLTREQVDVELRPKTAQLLRELILQRDTVISKRELIEQVWKTVHVTDQSLFQAMSELRAKLAPLQAIKTFPNRGYQWVAPVVDQARVVPFAAAASIAWLVAGLGTILAVVLMTFNSTENSVVARASLPALDSFSRGAAALQNGDADKAAELLQMSVIERPDFSEARLLLAEASLLGGNPLSARSQAQALIDSAEPLHSSYTLIGAMDLLSRSEQELGENASALQWAVEAVTHAGDEGFECTAADLQDRLWVLLDSTQHDQVASLTSPLNEPPLMQQILMAAKLPPLESSEVIAWSELELLLQKREETQRPAHCARPGLAPPASHHSLDEEIRVHLS